VEAGGLNGGPAMIRHFVLLAFLSLPGTALADHDGHLVAHISGGVGLEERDTFLARRGEFNLHLVFAHANGEYIADVETLLAEEHDGHVILRLVSDGPFVYAKLAPGRYTLAATYRGQTQRRELVVPPTGHVDATLYWKPS
jgi:hypothetical protein